MDEPIPNTARVTNNLILDSPGTYRRKARNTGVKKMEIICSGKNTPNDNLT